LKKSGNAQILVSNQENKKSEDWEKVEVLGIIPENGRAIMLETTLNDNQPEKTFLLDDIELEIVEAKIK